MQKTMYVTKKGEEFDRWSEHSNTLLARDWKGMPTVAFNAVIIIKDDEQCESQPM